MGIPLVDLNTVIRLFESGISAAEIARKYGVSKQAISQRIRQYYVRKRPRIYLETIVTRTCIVCGVIETHTVERIPISKLKRIRLEPIHKEEQFLCPLCDEQKLYKCTSCGSVGRLGDQFLKTPINEKNRRARCLDCNRTNRDIWISRNRERAREISRSYKKRLRKNRKENNLCTECGKKNDTPQFSYCSTCREKHKIYNNKSNNYRHLDI